MAQRRSAFDPNKNRLGEPFGDQQRERRRIMLTDDQIKFMLDRFLAWRLPEPWNPDNGISYKRPNYAHAPAAHDWPTGTNLFDAQQAESMIRFMLNQ